MISILIPLANGTEEMEAVIIIDIFRRAAFNVVVAGDSNPVICSRKVEIIPDLLLDEVNQEKLYDAIVLPGGFDGTENLSKNKYLKKILENQKSNNKLIGAICAAPLILASNNLFDANQTITSHPSVKGKLMNYNYTNDDICIDGNFITSRGAGTAIDFALKIVEILSTKELAEKIAHSIVYKY